MTKIYSTFLFNKLANELCYSSLNFYIEDSNHFSFYFPDFYITIQFNQLFIQSFDNKPEKNMLDFINYVKNMTDVIPPSNIFNKYFNLMLHPDMNSIHFATEISYQKIKEKIFSIESIQFFNTNISNEVLQVILNFPNIKNLTFKNCFLTQNCSFSKMKIVNITLINSNIESFNVFFNMSANLKLENTDIKNMGFGIYNGKNLEVENTSIDALFLNWSMPNLVTFIYKNIRIQNELFFLGCSAKNLENILIQGHVQSLDFLTNLSLIINLKIIGDKYGESCCINLTAKEIEKILKKFQHRLKLDIENDFYIKSLYLNGLTSFRFLLKNIDSDDIENYFHFYNYVISSDFKKNDGYFVKEDNNLRFHPLFKNNKMQEDTIKIEPEMYYLDGHPIYLKDDLPLIKDKKIKTIDINKMTFLLKNIIEEYFSQNFSFFMVMDLLFYEMRYFEAPIDTDMLKGLQERFKDDLDIYNHLENYIKLVEQKKELMEKYTKILNNFCAILLTKYTLFSKEEKAVLVYILCPLINSALNLSKKGAFHLSKAIVNEVVEKQNLLSSMDSLLQDINIKIEGIFLMFQDELFDLKNGYKEIIGDFSENIDFALKLLKK